MYLNCPRVYFLYISQKIAQNCLKLHSSCLIIKPLLKNDILNLYKWATVLVLTTPCEQNPSSSLLEKLAGVLEDFWGFSLGLWESSGDSPWGSGSLLEILSGVLEVFWSRICGIWS